MSTPNTGHLSISATDLKKAVKTIRPVINPNAVLDVLTCVLIDVDNQGVKFTGTNLDITLTVNAPVITASTFIMLIDHKQLMDVTNVLPNAPVNMKYDLDKMALTIECDGGIYKIGGMPIEQFPKSPAFKDEDPTITLPVAVIGKLKIATTFCSKDTLRPAMTGVLFELRDESIRFIATDAHRLYESEPIALEGGSAPNDSIPWMVVQKDAINKLTSMDVKDDLQFRWNANNALFIGKSFEMALRLIDARFPDYKAVKPDNSFSFGTEGNSLRSTLKMVSVSANKTTNQIVMNIEGDVCSMTAQDIDLNTESKKDLKILPGGDDMKLAVNASIFSELLDHVAGEPTIKYQTPTRALVVEGTSNKDYFLIMPLMVGV